MSSSKFSSHISIWIELGLHLSSPNYSNPDWNIQVCHLRHSYSTAAEFVYFDVIKLSSNCEFSKVFMHIFIKLACLILLFVKLFAFWITIIKHIHKNFFFFDKLFGKLDQKDNRAPPPPHPPDFCKNYFSSPIVDLLETGSCPAPKGVVRLSEVGRSVPKLVRGPMR